MKYQLVLQLPASSIANYDEMVVLEEVIIRRLGKLGEVDGHDVGSGEVNIFVLTDYPKLAFEQIKSALGTSDSLPDIKVAYREVGANNFAILHPSGLTHFEIK